MRFISLSSCALLVVLINLSSSQVPQRLQIPGAVLLQQPRPRARIQQRPQQQQIDPSQLQPRLRRPISNAIPAPIPLRETVRPVVEDVEEQTETSSFENEVARFALAAAQSNAAEEEEFIEEEQPRQVAFRPERPVPILREDIRQPLPQRPVARPAPVQSARPAPIPTRQGPPPNARPPPAPIQRPAPVPVQRPVQRPPPRPVIRHDEDDEEENIPIRKPVQQIRHQQPVRQPPRPRPQYDDNDDERLNKRRKPQVQILRKFRTDNEDGSITWGFENEDGTYKEETLGADCITRGKYGYVDPDGVRREFTYETGSKCEEEELSEELPVQNIPAKAPRRPY